MRSIHCFDTRKGRKGERKIPPTSRSMSQEKKGEEEPLCIGLLADHIPGWPGTGCVAADNLDFQITLLVPPKYKCREVGVHCRSLF